METQTIVLYEILAPVSNESFITDSRYEALGHYDDGSTVFERHRTLTQPSVNTQTSTLVTLRWNNNPDFDPHFGEEEQYGSTIEEGIGNTIERRIGGSIERGIERIANAHNSGVAKKAPVSTAEW